MIHINHNIILYELLKNILVAANSIIITYFEVKQMFISYRLVPNLSPYIQHDNLEQPNKYGWSFT